MASEPRYWFPAKRYGWGWGLPAKWQGWVVLAVYIALVTIGELVIPPDQGRGLRLGYVAILTLGLLAVCWAKGEPPRWRWGKD